MRVVFHPEAETEMLEAAQFYNRKVRGLGAEFLDAIDAAKVAVLQEPFRWRVIEQDGSPLSHAQISIRHPLQGSARSPSNPGRQTSQPSP